MLRVTRAWWTTIDSGRQNRTESLTHAFFKFDENGSGMKIRLRRIFQVLPTYCDCDYINDENTKESCEIVLCMQWRIAPSFKNLSHNAVRVLINQ